MHVNKSIAPSTALTVLLFLTSCSVNRDWRQLERVGLTRNQKLISVPKDPYAMSVSSEDRFYLYYYTTQPFDPNKGSVLFIAGGPGQVTTGDDPIVNSLTNGYNVIYFHSRGSGYSQFPESNSYDKYLRIKFAVEDIEEIRKDLKIDHWDAIISHSAGTVLAQEYAAKYGQTAKIRKLILIAPLSRGNVHSDKDAEKLAGAIRDKQVDTLKEIYKNEFNDLYGYQKRVLKNVVNIIDSVDEKFGNLQFVIDDYERLRNLKGHDLLKENSLDYSRPFFAALRQLRFHGWLPVDENVLRMQRSIGLIIAKEIACKTPDFSSWNGVLKTKKIVNKVPQETQETYSYCSATEAVDRLVSREKSLNFGTDTDVQAREMRDAQLKALEKIYNDEFRLPRDIQTIILNEVKNLLDRVEVEFGGLWFVIKKYDELSASEGDGESRIPNGPFAVMKPALRGRGGLSQLEKKRLPSTLELYKALQCLLDVTSPSPQDYSKVKRLQRFIGVIVIRVVAEEVRGLDHFSTWEPSVEGENVSYNDAIEAINKVDFDVPTQWARDMRKKQFAALREIFNNRFNDLNGYQATILRETERILDVVEKQFGGCLQCVIKNYNKLTSELNDNDLQGLGDGDPTVIFKALQRLGSDATKAHTVGAIIGKEIACRIANKLENSDEMSKNMPAVKGIKTPYCDAVQSILQDQDKDSERVYYVVSAYDGLSIGFLKRWFAADQNNVRSALRKSAGELHFERCGSLVAWKPCLNPVNQYIEKVGIFNDEIKSWDPAKFSHSVPTLILAGGGDPVVAGGQPEYIYNEALKGDRVLIRLPGIGHSMHLPSLLTPGTLGDTKACHGETNSGQFLLQDALGCLIASFVEMNIVSFKKAEIIDAMQNEFRNERLLGKFESWQNRGVEIFSCSPESQIDAKYRDHNCPPN